jgi:hypothetical protein
MVGGVPSRRLRRRLTAVLAAVWWLTLLATGDVELTAAVLDACLRDSRQLRGAQKAAG